MSSELPADGTTTQPPRTASEIYFDRLKKSVRMKNARELSEAAYNNERRLALFAYSYGSEILTCSEEEALDKLRSRNFTSTAVNKAMEELTVALKRREEYTERVF